MVLRFPRFALIAAAAAALSSACHAVASSARSCGAAALAFAIAIIDAIATPVDDLRALFDEPQLALETRGIPVDRALQQDMRHEAGMRTMAAARHI